MIIRDKSDVGGAVVYLDEILKEVNERLIREAVGSSSTGLSLADLGAYYSAFTTKIDELKTIEALKADVRKIYSKQKQIEAVEAEMLNQYYALAEYLKTEYNERAEMRSRISALEDYIKHNLIKSSE